MMIATQVLSNAEGESPGVAQGQFARRLHPRRLELPMSTMRICHCIDYPRPQLHSMHIVTEKLTAQSWPRSLPKTACICSQPSVP
jgi:hypothetical protein